MATVADNVLVHGFRGKFGSDIIFRTMRGKTFASPPARKPDKKKETEAQRSTRTNFRKAAEWAHSVLEDPEKKAYYKQRARALKLPNAYTAAITDFMRKPRVMKTEHRGTITYRIKKSGFGLKQVQVMPSELTGVQPKKIEIQQKKDTWLVYYTPFDSTASSLRLMITDYFGREIQFTDMLLPQMKI